MSETGEAGKTGILHKALEVITGYFGVNPDKLPAMMPLAEINEGAVSYIIDRDIKDHFAEAHGKDPWYRTITPSSVLANMGYHLPFGSNDLYQKYPVEHQKVNGILQNLSMDGVLDLQVLESGSCYTVIDPDGIQTRAIQWDRSRKSAVVPTP